MEDHAVRSVRTRNLLCGVVLRMFSHSIWLSELSGNEVSFILYKIHELIETGVYFWVICRQEIESTWSRFFLLHCYPTAPQRDLVAGCPSCMLFVVAPLLTQSFGLEIWETSLSPHPVSFEAWFVPLQYGFSAWFPDCTLRHQGHWCKLRVWALWGIFDFQGRHLSDIRWTTSWRYSQLQQPMAPFLQWPPVFLDWYLSGSWVEEPGSH